MGINDLIEHLKSGELADKLQGCEDIDGFVAKARELGYDISAEDVEEATDLTDEVLEAIAGGGLIDPSKIQKTTC